jgi:hypothetical protein
MRFFRSWYPFVLPPRPWSCLALLMPGTLLALLGAGFGRWADRATPRGLSYQFVPGHRLVFALEYLSAATLDISSFQGGQAPSPGLSRSVHTSVQCELVVQVLGVDGERVRLAYALRRPAVQMTLDGQPDVALAQALEARLQRPMFVEADRSGRIQSVRLSPDLGSVPSALSRALLAATQVVLPDSAADGLEGWEAEEDDLNGTAVVRYEPEAGSTGWSGRLRTLRKAKRLYRPAQQADAEGSPSALEYQPEGELQATVDARAQRLVSLQGTEATTVLVQGRVASRIENTLQLRLLRSEAASAAEQQDLEAEAAARVRTSPPLPLSARPAPEEGEAAVQQTELGEATLETLLAELARAEEGAEGALGETSLYLKFKALAYLRPEVSGRLGQHLSTARAPGVALRVLGSALADSGRPEAQAVLIAVVRARRNDWPALAELVPTLARVRVPTPAVEAALLELASAGSADISSTAQLALGTLAHGLAGFAPARADAIVSWAVDQWKVARSPTQRRQMLLVLGNAGSAVAWPVLCTSLHAAEPEVRGGAVLALRGLKGAEVDAALCKALTADPDAGVRLEAARTLNARPMTAATLAAHASALGEEDSPGVRLAVLRNLGRARQTFPEAVVLIRGAAANDPTPEVRTAAAALLEEEGASSPAHRP